MGCPNDPPKAISAPEQEKGKRRRFFPGIRAFSPRGALGPKPKGDSCRVTAEEIAAACTIPSVRSQAAWGGIPAVWYNADEVFA
jgi:hypothetical protein